MPDGLQYTLSSKFSSEGHRVSVVVCDSGTSLFMESYIREAVSNCLETTDSNKKCHVHLMLFTMDADCFQTVDKNLMTIYDFVRNPVTSLENLYEGLIKNIYSKPGKNHILVVDDYAIFSVLSSCRDSRRQSNFLRLACKQFRKLFLFVHKDSIGIEELGVIYDIASDIAFLQSPPEAGFMFRSTTKFFCNLLKIRPDRKVSHERTIVQVCNDEIREEFVSDSNEANDKSGRNDSDLLKNLTTFKLTLEDKEKESKSKLHLPYFEAQKTSLEDPENFDEYAEDEEDEEV